MHTFSKCCACLSSQVKTWLFSPRISHVRSVAKLVFYLNTWSLFYIQPLLSKSVFILAPYTWESSRLRLSVQNECSSLSLKKKKKSSCPVRKSKLESQMEFASSLQAQRIWKFRTNRISRFLNIFMNKRQHDKIKQALDTMLYFPSSSKKKSKSSSKFCARCWDSVS